LVNSESTAILTREFRKKLRQGKLSSNDKWIWLDLKSGRLPPKIRELSEDLYHIVYSPYTWGLIENSEIRENLQKVISVLSILNVTFSVPIWRLVAKSKNYKRFFILQELESFKFKKKLFSTFSDDTSLKEYVDLKHQFDDQWTEVMFKKIRRGACLKSNEWKTLLKFFKNNMKFAPFYLPLEPEKEYLWEDVKKELSKGLSERMEISKKRAQTLDEKAKSEIGSDIERIRKKLKKYGFDFSYKIWTPGY